MEIDHLYSFIDDFLSLLNMAIFNRYVELPEGMELAIWPHLVIHWYAVTSMETAVSLLWNSLLGDVAGSKSRDFFNFRGLGSLCLVKIPGTDRCRLHGMRRRKNSCDDTGHREGCWSSGSAMRFHPFRVFTAQYFLKQAWTSRCLGKWWKMVCELGHFNWHVHRCS